MRYFETQKRLFKWAIIFYNLEPTGRVTKEHYKANKRDSEEI